MAIVAIGPGVESVAIELYAASPDAGRWDVATWDGAQWGAPSWQAVGCQVGEATAVWGATDEAGVLSVAAAGQLQLGTIDPDRVLDPLNTSSPYYGAVKPGTPIRLTGTGIAGPVPVATALIDDASFDVAAERGRIRAVDGIAYLAQAQVPDGAVLPSTLRARVRAVVAVTGLGSIVAVAADLPDAPVDPPVAPFDGKARAAWAVISDAGLDALTYVWLDGAGVLRFTAWGSFPDAVVALGCPPPETSALLWCEGLATIEVTSQATAIRNTVRAWSATDTFAPASVDSVSVARYGPRPLDVARVVPDRVNWAQHILDDRAGAGLQVHTGEVRPYTPAELEGLLQARNTGPAHMSIRDDSHGELIDLDVAVIGGQVGMTPAGWRFEWVTMIPRAEWDAVTPEPPVPPIPPPNPYHQESRTYYGATDALLALTSGGANYGAGASSSLPVGVWSGWTYRSCLSFTGITWDKIRRVVSATLHLRTSTQDRVGFGSSPTIECRRITGAWSAGSASSPSSGNSVVYPGPATTSSGAVRANVTKSQSTDVNIPITAIATAWAPASIGGSSAAQRGIMLLPGSGSTADTSEFLPVEVGGAARPSVTLVLEVFD